MIKRLRISIQVTQRLIEHGTHLIAASANEQVVQPSCIETGMCKSSEKERYLYKNFCLDGNIMATTNTLLIQVKTSTSIHHV
jgi:hypothetical protein